MKKLFALFALLLFTTAGLPAMAKGPADNPRLRMTTSLGVVELELRIGVDGRVRDARVLRSSGYPRLDRAAVAEATRNWRLRPATFDGEPIEGVYRIKVTFRLDER